MRQIATDCEEECTNAARHFEHTPGVYFRFNVEQGLQGVGLEQWKGWMSESSYKTVHPNGGCESSGSCDGIRCEGSGSFPRRIQYGGPNLP